MGSPVKADDFVALSLSGGVCDRFKQLLRNNTLLNQLFGWLLDGDGNLSEEAAASIESYVGPVGMIVMWGGTSLPSDSWLVCNGQPVSRSAYPILYERYGTTWGAGDGSTTFNLPSFQDRFVRGAGASSPVGSSGGSDTKILSADNIPDITSNHFHGIGRRAGGAAIDAGNNDFDIIMREWTKTGTHHYNSLQGDESLSGNGDFSNTGNAATTNAIAVAGSAPEEGDAFDVKPAFASVYFIIKVK